MASTPTGTPQTWAELAAWMRERLAAAEQRAVRASISRARLPFEVVLDDSQAIDDAARALEQANVVDWERFWMGDSSNRHVACVECWRVLLAAFDHADQQYDGEAEADVAWQSVEEQLASELAALHEVGRELASSASAVRSTIAELPTNASSLWPLEPQGTEGEWHESWRARVAEGFGVDAEAFPLPAGQDRDAPIFGLEPAAQSVQDLGVWLQARAAWAEVLYELGTVLPAYRRASAERAESAHPAG